MKEPNLGEEVGMIAGDDDVDGLEGSSEEINVCLF